MQFLLLATPGYGSGRVYASFGPLERSVSVADLFNYARTGELPKELQILRRFLSSDQLERLRAGLSVSADIDVVTVSQFLYTTQGEEILQWLGNLIQTEGRQNGALAFRGATILAAADPDGGLNVLNILKHFPTQGVRVDLGNFLSVARVVINEVNDTQAVTAQIFEQVEATDNDANLVVPDLAAQGPNSFDLVTLQQTTLPTDLYLPVGEKLPLVVLSHGLGGNRSTLAYLAEHLASYGFAVAVVEHPGSSEEQISELLSGQVGEAVEPEEMVRRPVDVQLLLDELEALDQNESVLRNRLDFQHVGIVGHSMGAYTTLALAGATVNLDSLEESCPPQINQLNLSLLLQCLVLSLPQPLPVLQDERVQAAIAINALGSDVFSPTGMGNIKVPTMIVSGSADTVTPALAEQIRPFTWLSNSEGYLLLMRGGTHFSAIYDAQPDGESMALPDEAIGPNPQLAQDYIKAMGVAFLKTYLTEDEAYRQYLDPVYTTGLSQAELPMVLTNNVTIEN
ncbi:MAG: alpha/beta fold hydrolase [Cyanobacteria bacterium P01_D01_bin.156]